MDIADLQKEIVRLNKIISVLLEQIDMLKLNDSCFENRSEANDLHSHTPQKEIGLNNPALSTSQKGSGTNELLLSNPQKGIPQKQISGSPSEKEIPLMHQHRF